MPIGQTVVPYATFQEAFQSNPDQMNSAVQTAAAQAAGGDPDEQQRLTAAWHDAIGVLSQDAKPVLKMGDQGNAILHTPQNELASRLQTMLAKQATAAGQVQTVQQPQTIAIPSGDSFTLGVLSVKFDNDDIAGWLQMAPELIFKPPKADWIDPPPVPQSIRLVSFPVKLHAAARSQSVSFHQLHQCDHLGRRRVSDFIWHDIRVLGHSWIRGRPRW